MRMDSVRTLLVAGMVVLVAAGTVGCARKSVKAPPEPPAPPPTTTTAEPAAPAAPSPPAEATPVVTSADFQPAFFDFDSYALRDEARAALDRNARLLREHADLRITVEGHCDERGTVEYNQALGERRANSARDYLVAAGVAASRIQTVSYGKERPFADGQNETAWAQNRRAHVVLR